MGKREAQWKKIDQEDGRVCGRCEGCWVKWGGGRGPTERLTFEMKPEEVEEGALAVSEGSGSRWKEEQRH